MKKLTVFVDEGCGICKNVMQVLKIFVNNELVIFKYAKDMDLNPKSEPMKRRYIDLYSSDGSLFYSGYQSYLEITRRSVLLFPFHIVMKIPPIRRIGEKIYRRIADSRACEI